jgi:hypothetical protein
MRNLFQFRAAPQIPLPLVDRFSEMTQDGNRHYCKKLTHFYSWEIVALEMLQKEIAAARQTSWRPTVVHKGESGHGRPPKLDPLHRLLFVLEWLATGDFGDRQEFTNKYKVLKDEIKWPTAAEQAAHYATYDGIFKGMVGIFDVIEWEIAKSTNSAKENATYSGKAKTNTMKTLAVIDKNGYFIWYDPLAYGKRNDRDMFTSSDLYLYKGEYFSPMAVGGVLGFEFMASDGGFRGNGPLLYTYDNLSDEDKVTFNLAFKEVRVGVENAFGRVQKWFPILGIQKSYWNYDEEMLELAVGAAMKLHNWMLRTRGLAYDAQNDPQNHLRHLY